MYINLDNVVRQIEIAQRDLDSINYHDLSIIFNNASRIYEENRRILEAWNGINETMFINLEVSIPNISQIANLYNSTLKNINPSLLDASKYSTIIDTAKIFNQIEINIEENNIISIINDLNYYNKDLGLEINNISEIENIINENPSEDNIIEDIIDKSLAQLKREKKIAILGTLFSLLVLIKSNGAFPEETMIYLNDLIEGVFWLLMGVLYDRFV